MSEVSGMYKIAVLGERESVMGFAALGLAVFPVDLSLIHISEPTRPY